MVFFGAGEIGPQAGAPSSGSSGVTQIVAGTNVTISPPSGTGVVTINATGGGGSGTVTTVSVVTANGLAGTVANASTTPAITLSTTVTGLLKGNGTAISAATSGTDYAPGTAASATGLVVSTTGTGALSTVAAPAGTVVGTTDTQTLTNKRITNRVSVTSAPGATPSMNTDNFDEFRFTGLAANITSMSSGLTGTPQDGDTLIITFTDNGTARTLIFGSSFIASGTIALPLTTVAGVLLTTGWYWNPTSGAWVILGVS